MSRRPSRPTGRRSRPGSSEARNGAVGLDRRRPPRMPWARGPCGRTARAPGGGSSGAGDRTGHELLAAVRERQDADEHARPDQDRGSRDEDSGEREPKRRPRGRPQRGGSQRRGRLPAADGPEVEEQQRRDGDGHREDLHTLATVSSRLRFAAKWRASRAAAAKTPSALAARAWLVTTQPLFATMCRWRHSEPSCTYAMSTQRSGPSASVATTVCPGPIMCSAAGGGL